MIVLYTAFRSIGGVEQLVINLARELARLKEPFAVLAPGDSVVRRALSAELEAPYLWDSDSPGGIQRLTADHLLLLPNPQDAIRLRWPNPRVLFWNVFPEVLAPGRTWPVRVANRALKRWMVGRLEARHSVCFMDDTGVRWMRRAYGLELASPQYLPVPVPVHDCNRFLEKPALPDPSRLSVTYLGRAVDWKVLPFALALERLAAIAAPRQVHVFTDDAAQFRSLLRRYGFAWPGDITWHENVLGEALRQELVALSDLHFAMGTSALDGAGLGIPTILVDPFSLRSLAEHIRYRWMHETLCYSLGELVTPENRVSPGRPLSALISEYRHDVAVVSHQCRQYVKHHHAIGAVTRRFVALAGAAHGRLRTIHQATCLDMVEIGVEKMLRRTRLIRPAQPAAEDCPTK